MSVQAAIWSDAADPRPALWIVTRDFGLGSEVWILRQIAALRRFRPVVLTWADHRSPALRAGMDVPVHVLPFAQDLSIGPARWKNRLARIPGWNFYASQGAERRHLQRLAEAAPPAVILAHFGHTALRILPVARAIGVPLICHFHGLDLSSALNNRWYRWSLLRHIDHVDALITVGSRQRHWVAGHFARAEALHQIPCGVPVAEFSRGPAEAQAVETDPPVFAIVSRLVPQKGVDWCLRALALLPRGTARLQIVGDGPERSRLQILAQELGIAAEVVFLGPQPPAGVRQVLLGATALLQHSLDAPDGWYEGFGVTVAEASAMQVPTIASRCGGLMDQVEDGETGLLVEQRDAGGLSAAMQRLMQDRELRDRLGQAARHRAVAEFDTTAQVARLEAVLLAAMAARNACVKDLDRNAQ
jgi:colanic acid/amylovoran biosynthesis glycosyltransferase